MYLAQALRMDRTARLALVGSGGKTSVLFQIAREMVGDLRFPGTSPAVLVTATAHLALAQLHLADQAYEIQTTTSIDAIFSRPVQGVLLFTGPANASFHLQEQARTAGLDPESLARLLDWADRLDLPLLIEADGSRQRPLKAPASHEPPIPGFATQVAVVAGMSAIGQPLSEAWVHRPELYAGLSGLSPGQPITLEAAAEVLRHPQGGLKDIPASARRVLLLNQVDGEAGQAAARQLADQLVPPYHAAVAASLLAHSPAEGGPARWVREPSAGIILAAGAARRFGEPKQLLEVEGEPLVRRAVLAALEGGLRPVIAVLGAHANQVEAALQGLPVERVVNPNWESGQSSSLKAGLNALPPETGSAVFLLADQPWVPGRLVQALVDRHAQTLAQVVAPRLKGRRANPVLFDRSVFPELNALHGDVGGRALFKDPQRYSVAWIEWEDERLAHDIDTREDYAQLSGGVEDRR